MSIALPALAVAFAAICVWLTLRIVNRRERWAKWTLAVVVVLAVMYPLSYGPAVWLEYSFEAMSGISTARIYEPCNRLYWHGPPWYSDYCRWWMHHGLRWAF